MKNKTKLMVGVIAVLSVFLIAVSNTTAGEKNLPLKTKQVYVKPSKSLNPSHEVSIYGESSFWYILLYKLGINSSPKDQEQVLYKERQDNFIIPIPGKVYSVEIKSYATTSE